VVKLQIQKDTMIKLLSDLADLEVRLSCGSTERIQLGALVGSFQLARNIESDR
jgi:hypothetical protein